MEAAGTKRLANGDIDYSTGATVVVLAWLAFVIAYHPVSWYFKGQTFGQRALGLKVVRAADGLRLGVGAVLIRFIIFAVCTCTIVIGLIAAAMASEDPMKRAWQDQAARSVVIRLP